MNVLIRNSNLRTKVVYLQLQRCLNRLSERMQKILNDNQVIFVIADIKKELNLNVSCSGCYFTSEIDGQLQKFIYIDENCSLIMLRSVLCHEIGHLLDEIMGCKYNNVPISLKNVMKYKFSLTYDSLKDAIKDENDFFTQINYGNNCEDIMMYNFVECFADCVSELLTGSHIYRCARSKQIILNNLKSLI